VVWREHLTHSHIVELLTGGLLGPVVGILGEPNDNLRELAAPRHQEGAGVPSGWGNFHAATRISPTCSSTR
jgi:hypothetical protein